MSALSDAAPSARIAPPDAAWRRDRMFYGGMAAAAALTVLAGFAPTYFLRSFSTQPALSPLLHVHGLIFTAWIVLFITQVSLVAIRRVDIHRRLGIVGGVLAILMLIVGTLAAIGSARRGFSPPGAPPALVFLVIPIGDLVVFAGLVGSALYYRRRPEIHRRLMLLTTLALLTPAIARLPLIPSNPLAFFGITDLYIIVCLVYDRLTRGRIHPAFLYGALFVILSQPLRLLIGGTSTWLAVATWITH